MQQQRFDLGYQIRNIALFSVTAGHKDPSDTNYTGIKEIPKVFVFRLNSLFNPKILGAKVY
jgi:hypothetical protein